MNNPIAAAAAWAVRRYGRPKTELLDHNAARWLTVQLIDRRWWVIRTCPCHAGEPVAAPYKTEAEALRCVHKLVTVSERLGT